MFSLNKNLACGIGSLPYRDANQAVDFVINTFKNDIPFWPQLPKRSFLEQMTVQFCEKFPGISIDTTQSKIYVDTKSAVFGRELEDCFQHYLDDDTDYFSVSPEFSAGFHEFCRRIKDTPFETVKGQVVGPITLGMSLLTGENQPIIYDPDLKEALVKLLAMKARWQIRKLKSQNPKVKTIIFIDEPYLVSFGSSFFTLKKEDVRGITNEVIDAVHKEGASCGIHCCANTDWSIVLSTNADILGFDAYGYLDNLLLYADALNKFVERGGILSFGIVPNNEEAEKKNNKEELLIRIKKTIKDRPKIGRILVTPSCGCGTLDAGLSDKIHRSCVEIARALNQSG